VRNGGGDRYGYITQGGQVIGALCTSSSFPFNIQKVPTICEILDLAISCSFGLGSVKEFLDTVGDGKMKLFYSLILSVLIHFIALPKRYCKVCYTSTFAPLQDAPLCCGGPTGL
jgi:hypothetical protein